MEDTRKSEGLKALGAKTQYKMDYAPEVLETFVNKHQDHDYWVRFNCPCVNIIMEDLIKLMDPKYIEVTGLFTPRGGISIYPYANYGRKGTRYELLAQKRFETHE